MRRSGYPNRRRVCFVTGTRAEYGLMRSTLAAIKTHSALQLQLVATGMHLDRSRGRSLDTIKQDGWNIDAVIPWARGDGSERDNAVATGRAAAAMASTFARLQSDVVLVVGDRVEAFAAASAGHLSGCIVAHVHGGDRALGLVDDSLRHAISKLAHIHFPATAQSALRLAKLGENRWRIFQVGSPGLDDVRTTAASRARLAAAFPGIVPRRYAMLILHPQATAVDQQRRAAELLARAAGSVGFERIVVIHPNTDPGSEGIVQAWRGLSGRFIVCRNLARPEFLGLLRDAAVLAGNSSSGIIEAASFGTPVLDIGVRQAGRERGSNIAHAPVRLRAIQDELNRIWNDGDPIRFPSDNIYGSGGAGRRISAALARISLRRYLPKLIAY